MGKTFDDEAVEMAERMMPMAKSIPTSRREAEGGFTEEAGGQLIDVEPKGEKTMKSKTAITSEPGHEGPGGKVTTAITNEPSGQDAGGACCCACKKDPCCCDTATRARKPGKVGISGAPESGPGAGLDQAEDEQARQRKGGKVGIGKSDDGDEDDKDGDEDEDEAEKSLVAVDDLMKSLDVLEAASVGGTVPSAQDRSAELAEKFASGTLEKSERAELTDLLKAQDEEPPVVEESFQERFATDADLQKGYDVSPFLELQSQRMAAALDQVGDRIEKSLANAKTFNGALAKSLRGLAGVAKSQTALIREQGEMIKSLTGRLETVENQPLPRRGITGARQLNKSLSGEAGAGAPSRGQMLEALEKMAMTMERSPSGHDLQSAVCRFETSGEIAKSLQGDVAEFMRKSNAA